MIGGEDYSDPRFGPPPRQAGEVPSPSWEPGLVEAEFQEGVRPQLVAATTDTGPTVRTAGDDPLSELNALLRRFGLQRAEATFETDPAEADLIQRAAAERGEQIPNLGSFLTLVFPADADVVEIAEALSQLPEVERAVPVPRAIPPQMPLSEPLVGTSDQVVAVDSQGLERQWYIFRCAVDRAWSGLTAPADGVVVADVDWGYRTTHVDLRAQLDLDHAYNAYDGGSDVSHGTVIHHGTGVMGLMGAAVNGTGTAGIAFRAALWPIQANDGPGTPLVGDPWARGIEHVRTEPTPARKVIVLEVQTSTYGNYEMVPSVNAAIRTAIASNVVVCVAAGNGDRDAAIDDLGNHITPTGSILVGATQYDPAQNVRAWFSNFGSTVVVSAPGDPSHDLTCSSASDEAYRNGFGGTSGATPKVAGTAALMLGVAPGIPHEQVRRILRQTGTAVVTESWKQVGTFLDADAAVAEAREGTRVPFVKDLNRNAAVQIVRAAGLVPKFTGASSPDAFVWKQLPSSGTKASWGATVSMLLVPGPPP
jgi:subtilisin family serine protease